MAGEVPSQQKSGMNFQAWCWREDRTETYACICNDNWVMALPARGRWPVLPGGIAWAQRTNWQVQNCRFNTGGSISCKHQPRGQHFWNPAWGQGVSFPHVRKIRTFLRTHSDSILRRQAGEGKRLQRISMQGRWTQPKGTM